MTFFKTFSATAAAAFVATSLAFTNPAAATAIAVFGDNQTDEFINTLGGFTATVVTDAQIATPGFLAAFDAFVYTRDGASFGSTLSAAAAAEVKSFVTGNVTLLVGDFADGISTDTNIQTLYTNALNFITTGGKGYLGEFNGAVAALTSNSDGFTALDLVAGSAGGLGFGNGNSADRLVATQPGHPVLTGAGLPINPDAVEFGALVTVVDPSVVIAEFVNGIDNNAPGIIAAAVGPNDVPAPGTLALLAAGLATLGGMKSRRKA